MSKHASDTTVATIDQAAATSPETLTTALRTGAQRLVPQAAEAELEAHLAARKDLVDDRGQRQVVRHGHVPEREVRTGIGPIAVPVPPTRVRTSDAPLEPIQSRSSLLPPYLRRTRSLERLLLRLYRKAVSTGAFEGCLRALRGREAPGLSASANSRQTAGWEQGCEHWSRRDLSREQYVHVWAERVNYQACREEGKQRLLALI